jgi:ATP-dependent Zn protease
MLDANRGALNAAAEELLAKETLTGEEMLDIIKRHPATAAIAELEPASAVCTLP